MNIFETIAKTTSRMERFHSQFLADALCESMTGDRSLFEQVWRLVAPCDWEIPESSDQVKVMSEQRIEGGRVDICMQCLTPQRRVVGIEVKTVEESTEPGQLERYRAGLAAKFRDCAIQVAYITPFNEDAGIGADSLPSVREFTEFKTLNPRARHVSWLDLTSIPWDGNPLWGQHQAYVREHISSQEKLQASVDMNRDLAYFFGAGPAEDFWKEVSALKVEREGHRAIIDLESQQDVPSTVSSLLKGLETLIRNDNVVERERNDKFDAELRRRFLNSRSGGVHDALFGLSQRFDHVWVEGKNDYGVRVTHIDFPSGVSLVTSNGPNRLLILVNR